MPQHALRPSCRRFFLPWPNCETQRALAGASPARGRGGRGSRSDRRPRPLFRCPTEIASRQLDSKRKETEMACEKGPASEAIHPATCPAGMPSCDERNGAGSASGLLLSTRRHLLARVLRSERGLRSGAIRVAGSRHEEGPPRSSGPHLEPMDSTASLPPAPEWRRASRALRFWQSRLC